MGTSPDLAGYSVVYADGGSAVAIAPFAGSRHPILGLSAPGYPDQPVRSGTMAVVVGGGEAYALSPSPAVAPEVLGPASHIFPVRTPGAVGVYRNATLGSAPAISEVKLTPHIVTSPATPFPEDALPVAGLRSGILTWGGVPGSLLRVWRPGTAGSFGGFTRTLGEAAGIVGALEDRVAWISMQGCTSLGECPLHISDISTGRDVVVRPPPGHLGYLAGGSFAPNNPDVLAAFVAEPINPAGGARLVLIRLVSLAGSPPISSPVVVAQASVLRAPKIPPLATWTPDGEHILFSGGSQGVIHDYRPGLTSSFSTGEVGSSAFTILLNNSNG